MGTLLQDVRYGWRMLVKKPTFTIVAVLTLAIMASLLYGVRPHDPAVFLIVPLFLFAAAVLASDLPVRRDESGPDRRLARELRTTLATQGGR